MKRFLISLALMFVGLPQPPASAAENVNASPDYDCALIASTAPPDLEDVFEGITDVLAHALAWNDWNRVRQLIWRGVDPEWVRGSQFYEAALREAPNAELVKAAAAGDEVRVKAALKAGANVNVTAEVDQYMSPLIWAAACDQLSTVHLLFEHGADARVAANAYDTERNWAVIGHTALIAAAYYANVEVVDILLKRGADVNAQEYTIPDTTAENPKRRASETPLLAAGGIRTAEMLLDHGANPNVLTWDGTSALMEAASLSQRQWSKMLLEYGAMPKLRNIYGKSAADMARKRFDNALADLIESWDAGKPESK